MRQRISGQYAKESPAVVLVWHTQPEVFCYLVFAVLLYVRTESEEVFDALMLSSPTLKGLRQAVGSTLMILVPSLPNLVVMLQASHPATRRRYRGS
jgi:hypothetical protein